MTPKPRDYPGDPTDAYAPTGSPQRRSFEHFLGRKCTVLGCTTCDPEAAFPIDWNEWNAEWAQWLDEHLIPRGRDGFDRIGLRPTTFRFPGKNFLADEVLGTWSVNGRNVELSAVTMPNLSERDPRTGRLLDTRHRYVGITFVTGAGSDSALASNFAELEAALGL